MLFMLVISSVYTLLCSFLPYLCMDLLQKTRHLVETWHLVLSYLFSSSSTGVLPLYGLNAQLYYARFDLPLSRLMFS